MRPLLRARNLTLRLAGKHILEDIHFQVEEGESIAFWGHNGAGKTSLIRCLLGVYRFQGEVEMLGEDPRRNPAVRRRVGYVPQDFPIVEGWRVETALRFLARLRGIQEARVLQEAEKMGLQEFLDRPVAHLSGGFRQRLALTVALLGEPPLLFLDEPTANLDVEARAQFLETLRALRERGTSLILATHREEELSLLADRIYLLEGGKLVGAEGVRALPATWIVRIRVEDGQREAAERALRDRGWNVRAEGPVLEVPLHGEGPSPVHVLRKAAVRIVEVDLQRDHRQ